MRVENVRLYPSPRATLTRYIASGLAQAYAAANAVVASMLRDNASLFGLSRQRCWLLDNIECDASRSPLVNSP